MKKIVLLSDGTGNGAAKRHKTNVWRLYKALDLHRKDQIAMYDDGVGSQQFLLFKLLGGAFGWGLKRNVIELYKFLCRNYVDGDRIYLFGFSRGAFTVRVLAGLIDKCGLHTNFKSEGELDRTAHAEYSNYREKYRRRQFSTLLYKVWRSATRFLFPKDDDRLRVIPRIEFMGVWDTVDAYCLPVDELANWWDRFIFPIQFPDRRLSERVMKACHALSIDDERHTFHPVLWDESGESNSGRIEQVWFPGVHSDVGGGYPHHGLALVSLDWMISNVEASVANPFGLAFLNDLRAEYRRRCDWSGIQHDSRAGLRAFYRYKPRNIDELCKDAGATDGKTRLPKLHHSAFERIRENVVPYAPTGLPQKYQIVTTRGMPPVFENNAEKIARFSAMNFALDVVYWRRWLYRAFLGTTVLLVVSRFFLDWQLHTPCAGLDCMLDPVCAFAAGVLPNFAVGWFEALCQNPGWFVCFAVAYTVLIVLKRVAAARTVERAAAAWHAVKLTQPGWPTMTSRLRTVSAGALGRVTRKVWWAIIALVVLAVILVTLDRMLFNLRDSAGWLCEPASVPKLETGQKNVAFDTARPCLPTGVALVAGRTYSFDVTVDSPWMDRDLPAGPDGLVGSMPFTLKIATPFRRRLSRPWFELTGRIGQSGGETIAVGSGTCYTARSDGALYLYVNDGVSGLAPGSWWAFPYFWSWGSNSGTATVSVSAVKKSSPCDGPHRCESCGHQTFRLSSRRS